MRNFSKKTRLAAVCVVLILAVAIGATLAYLQDVSEQKVNTFEKCDISVTLTETTGTTYKIVPGNAVDKDPLVTVYSPDVDCWCFVEVTDETDNLVTWAAAEGWSELDGTNLYYRVVDRSEEAQEFYFLQDNQVSFDRALKTSDMGDLSVDAVLSFKAYVIQKDAELNTPETAYAAIVAEP